MKRINESSSFKNLIITCIRIFNQKLKKKSQFIIIIYKIFRIFASQVYIKPICYLDQVLIFYFKLF